MSHALQSLSISSLHKNCYAFSNWSGLKSTPLDGKMVESPNLMKTSGDASIPAPGRHYGRSHAYGWPRGGGLVRRDHGWGLAVGRHPSRDKTGHSLGWIWTYNTRNPWISRTENQSMFHFLIDQYIFFTLHGMPNTRLLCRNALLRGQHASHWCNWWGRHMGLSCVWDFTLVARQLWPQFLLSKTKRKAHRSVKPIQELSALCNKDRINEKRTVPKLSNVFLQS